MWKELSWIELAGVVGRAFGAAVLCAATTAVLMYPVVAPLIVR